MIFIIRIDDEIKPMMKIPKKHMEDMNEYVKFFEDNREKWYNSDELSNIFMAANTSQIRQIINYLRVKLHQPIISNNRGYKYTTNSKKLKEYYKRLQYRALTQLSAAKAIKKLI